MKDIVKEGIKDGVGITDRHDELKIEWFIKKG